MNGILSPWLFKADVNRNHSKQQLHKKPKQDVHIYAKGLLATVYWLHYLTVWISGLTCSNMRYIQM